ncbi:DUF4386 family protein [Sinisalibacter aestuarii]|uniref:DUF4386 family protein n=1 Tax=Sinisalibacter aestuarii TaxID=2949426 RepID=A0ABQ5LQK6_9RHOB|nr:DUF4386 family protein [Sinisalibacter aestuarii]GKY86546.1 hypothetical protein STA1M1_04150 [Sinisalibacter aestuarii]
MISLTRWGAAAALLDAATYIFGFALLTTVLASSGYGSDGADPAQIVAFLVENTGLMTVWNLAIYVVNGLALALLAVALWHKFRPAAPGLAQVVLTFGALWATLVVGAGMVANVGLAEVASRYATDPEEAVRMWEIILMVENGLGGGNEIAGGVWAILVGAAVLTTGMMSRWLGWLSLVIGVSGLLTVLPGLGDTAGAIFGLGYIVWFVWVGIALLRDRG